MIEMSFNPRYIKAEEAEERIVALWRKEKGTYADVFNTAIDACQTVILDMYDNSSRDVVPVVRCKDCRHCIHNEFTDSYYCWRFSWSNPAEKDGYCSWGERRENDTDEH